MVTDKNSILGLSHQKWQMNEVNKLIWPAVAGVGTIDDAAWRRTTLLSQETINLEGGRVLTEEPDAEAYTNEIVTEAHTLLTTLGVDINGTGFTPVTVTLNEGGA
jgi:NitT/TauT family transport system substrate-binding protein